MKTCDLFARLQRPAVSRCAAALKGRQSLVFRLGSVALAAALGWTVVAFGGEIHTAVPLSNTERSIAESPQRAEPLQAPSSPSATSATNGGTKAEVTTTRDAATVKGGSICYAGKSIGSIRCMRSNFLTKGLLDTTPRLHLIDGKGPGRSGLGGTFNSRWDAGFKVPVTAGRHALTVSYHQSVGMNGALTSDDLTVAFVAAAGHSYVVDALVSGSTFSPGGWTPIVFDVTEKDETLVQVWGSPALESGIHVAASDGDLAQVDTLLKQNSSWVSSKDNDQMTPLHWAVQNNHKEVVELLLANHAEIDAKEKNGNTSLELAAFYGRKEPAELLLANNASVSIKNNGGWTPLHAAAQNGNEQIAHSLLAHGAEVDAVTTSRQTPLLYAAVRGNSAVAELLLANKADVNAKDQYGETPLHFAALHGHTEVMELLLAHGADPNARDNKGKTPMGLAVAFHRKDAEELLRKQGGRK